MVALEDNTNPFTVVQPTKPAPTITQVEKPVAHTSISELAARIEACESGGNPTARNAHSTAKGLYQFLDGTWRGYAIEYWGTTSGHDVFNPDDNRELAMYVLNTYGAKDWYASKHCWA
jgi:transglycosylase-like protein with SLT domain